jgi:23S rRNA (guanosine2251-2'-O)-methyltransferase
VKYFPENKQIGAERLKKREELRHKCMSGHLPLRMRKLGMDELDRKSVNEFRESEKTPVIVVLDNIRSMHNVGSVFRTADAFLLQGIYLCGYTPQPPHRDIHKTALGATETVEWKYFPSAADAVLSLREQGYKIFAVEQVENSIPLQEFATQPSGGLAVIFGNEVSGVGDAVLALCDGSVEIPQWGMKHSLNISVAAGIVLWELVRGRFRQTLV